MKPIYVILILLMLSPVASALTQTLKASRVYYPENQTLIVDLGSGGLFNWEDIFMTITINGPATFSDGYLYHNYTFTRLTDNKVITETMKLTPTEHAKESIITVNTSIKYTIPIIGGFSKKGQASDKTQFIAIWTNFTQCEVERETCTRSEDMLQDKIRELKQHIAAQETELDILRIEKEQYQSMLQKCNNTATTRHSAHKLTAYIASIIIIIGIAIYLFTLRKTSPPRLKGKSKIKSKTTNL